MRWFCAVMLPLVLGCATQLPETGGNTPLDGHATVLITASRLNLLGSHEIARVTPHCGKDYLYTPAGTLSGSKALGTAHTQLQVAAGRQSFRFRYRETGNTERPVCTSFITLDLAPDRFYRIELHRNSEHCWARADVRAANGDLTAAPFSRWPPSCASRR